MSEELRRYYEARFEMFGTKGWRDLVEDVQKMHDATNQVTVIKDENDLFFRKGEISIMKWLLSLEKVSEDTFKQLEERHENDA